MTKEALLETLSQRGLDVYLPQLAPFLRPAIYFQAEELREEQVPIGASKRFGKPDLPHDFVWPKRHGAPCTFLCQINLSKAAPFDVAGLLPKEGLLSFFHGDEEFGLGELNGDPVYFFPAGTPLVRRQDAHCEYGWPNTQRLQFAANWALPNPQTSRKLDFLGRRTPTTEAVWALKMEFEQGYSGSHLLGHVDDYQGDLEPNCELIYHGVRDPEMVQSLRGTVEKLSFFNWLCLLGETEFCGGVFTLNYCIRRDDLANLDFSKTISFAVN